MKYLIPYFTNSNQEFQALEPSFLEILDETEQLASQQLGLKHKIDVIIMSSTSHKPVDKNGGVGLTYGKDLIIFFVDPSNQYLDWCSIKMTFVHELTHIVNRLTAPWEENNTLLDMMLAEGIAITAEAYAQNELDSFAKLTEKMPHAQIQELLEKLRPHFQERDFDTYVYLGHRGDPKNSIPPWTGYIIGRYLIKSYLQLSKTDLKTLVRTPYNDIKKALKTGGVL